MSETQLEETLRRRLADEAADMTIPEANPHERLANAMAEQPQETGRGRWLMAAAVVAALTIGAAYLASARGATTANQTAADQGQDEGSEGREPSRGTPGPGSSSTEETGQVEAPFSYQTATASLSAQRITVDVGGRTFTPNDTVQVHSDPGLPDEYTTLELTWFEDGIEMRIFLYFQAVNSDWWVSEIRTYDGSDPGEWITVEEEHFLSRLGSAYEGDASIGPLTMEGLVLEGFLAPDACATSPHYAIQPDTLAIEGAYSADLATGYALGVTIYDTTTCTPAPIEQFDLQLRSGDESILTVQRRQGSTVDLQFSGPGTTILTIELLERSTGELFHAMEIPVVVAG